MYALYCMCAAESSITTSAWLNKVDNLYNIYIPIAYTVYLVLSQVKENMFKFSYNDSRLKQI